MAVGGALLAARARDNAAQAEAGTSGARVPDQPALYVLAPVVALLVLVVLVVLVLQLAAVLLAVVLLRAKVPGRMATAVAAAMRGGEQHADRRVVIGRVRVLLLLLLELEPLELRQLERRRVLLERLRPLLCGSGGPAARAVQFHPHGGQFDFVWLSARTPHGAYVW